MNQDPFPNNSVTTIPITNVVSWTKEGGNSRLFLPPIQRSVVWRNSQIINYWDSLLRGYPAGLMMVHRPKVDADRARTTDGHTRAVRTSDFQLFDGQQRLTAILLGLGEGPLKDRLKLWVDLGIPTPADSELQFVLRISSVGQPFGYQTQSPNEKQPLRKRRDKATEWMKRPGNGRFDSKRVFDDPTGNWLIDAQCAVPLLEISRMAQMHTKAEVANFLNTHYPDIPKDRIDSFVFALTRALSTPVLFQLIDKAVIESENEYIRFFARLGQGGTKLSDDELTYSIIKHHFPEVHDRMTEITNGPAGRVSSEVNLVLAALRVAKVSAPWNCSGEWQIYGRPRPAFVSQLKELSGVRDEFHRMIPMNGSGKLKELLESIRNHLVYDKKTNPAGLPAILLAKLPHQLVDVLLLMENHSQAQDEHACSLPAFALFWLLFVADSEKAANLIYKRFYLKDPDWCPRSDKRLIRIFEEQGVSRRLPNSTLLGEAREDIIKHDHLLRTWEDRFAALDTDKDRPAGNSLRVLSTNGELIRRALLWLQRDYLAEQFPGFDPTSSRDEDLPIDLDHLIPRKKFGEDWRLQQKHIKLPDSQDNFRQLRGIVGNSLGNYRWLDASVNRSRQADQIEDRDRERDFIENLNEWNALIEANVWEKGNVAAFQRMIDLRSLTVYETLLNQGGIDVFVSDNSAN